jgi:DNA topoisomerase-1
VAQELYEGVNLGSALGGVTGLITYMRTDSVRISDEAYAAANSHILSAYGESFLPASRRVYKTKSGAQDAHEAIRPVDPAKTPEMIKGHVTGEQFKLYRLIWARFLASQMASARYDTVSADLECAGFQFKAAGSALRFAGFLSLYDDTQEESDEEGLLPDLEKDQILPVKEVLPEQHFTEPPARFNEGSLVKFLEEKGIGRPSTFATIVTTIIQRGYVAHEGKSLVPTELGVVTTALMKENFANVVDYGFTAQMEEQLDGIENGGSDMIRILSDFYGPFSESLDKAMKDADEKKIELPPEETDIFCDKCGARMVVKNGRFGKFAACPNYPECKNTKQLAKDGKSAKEEKTVTPVEGMTCEKCGGPMVVRTGRYGSFFACAAYPKCTYTKQPASELDVNCPLCGKKVVAKRGKNKGVFYSCSGYPGCSFSSWDLPTNEKCPDCGKMLFIKKGKELLVCHEKDCGYQAPAPAREGQGE